MRVVSLALAVLSSVAALAGCVENEGDCQSVEAPAIATPLVGSRFMATDARSSWDTLVLVPDGHANAALTAATDPAWNVTFEAVAPGSGLTAVRVLPRGDDGARMRLSWEEWHADGSCRARSAGALVWDLMAPKEGASAHPGQGVHVYTAGFWENGTLFYTNIQAIHDDPRWPKAGWYEWEGGEPLPVYVYDADRSEKPMLWSLGTAGTPVGPPTDNLTVWNYFTTIPGFNQALKGLSKETVRVARLAPGEAYTRAGNEEHPLYGDAIVFYIKVVDVVDVPCPDVLGSPSPCSVPAMARQA